MYGLIPFGRRTGLARTGRDDLSDMFERVFNTSWGMPSMENAMKCDIKEKDKEYLLEVELPGVKKEDISIDLEDGVLTVAVKAQEEDKKEEDNYIVQERKYGGCQRSFRVGAGLTQKDIKAKYEDGILNVVIPKKDEVKKETKVNID